MNEVPQDLLVLAGAGSLPRLVLEGARAAGVGRLGALGLRGTTERRTLAAADWRTSVTLRSLAAFREAIRASGFRHAILAGQIRPLSLFRAAFDPEVRGLLRSLRVLNAHTIFGRMVAEIEALGVEVLPSSLFLGAHVPEPGTLSRRKLSSEEERDMAFGTRLALAESDLDVGQTVVVKDGVALAVEGFDGTDATILRGGRIARRGAMVVKAAKRGHDMRFDIPVVGMKTIAAMRKSRCASIVVQARRTLFIDLPAVIRAADKAGIAVVAADSGLPPAPVAGR
ncbi:MAG: UDP-2,3-diacylglucosamine diphosphatase LpxI [Kiritimatiellae bacterium]|nr:UDP-2,3-diacylglucosamine diphosphatase LpxI [Kiritimatiellia bacterium]